MKWDKYCIDNYDIGNDWNSRNHGMVMYQAWNPDYVSESKGKSRFQFILSRLLSGINAQTIVLQNVNKFTSPDIDNSRFSC